MIIISICDANVQFLFLSKLSQKIATKKGWGTFWNWIALDTERDMRGEPEEIRQPWHRVACLPPPKGKEGFFVTPPRRLFI